MRIRDSGPRAAAGRVAVSALLVAATTAGPLAAQVGNPPSRSPFHDLTARQAFTFSAGRFGGNAGGAGVGWRPGAMAAVRLDTRIGGPVDFYVSIGFAGSSFYKKDGSVKAPNGSTEQFDYFRLRQSWLDLVATRRATEELARTNQLHPCGK